MPDIRDLFTIGTETTNTDSQGETYMTAPITGTKKTTKRNTKENKIMGENNNSTDMEMAMDEAIAAMTNDTDATEEKPKKAPAKRKPAAKAPAKAKPAAKAPAKPKAPAKEEKAKEAPVKPEPTTYKGYEVAEGVNPSDIEALTKGASDALANIKAKDGELLAAYLTMGEFQSKASGMFKSTKLYGEYLKTELPASQDLDAALRSNCKWLWEALNNEEHDAFGKLLPALGLGHNEGIEQYKSGNPTVIKRAYKQTEKEAELKKKAADLGIDEGEEDIAKAVKETENEKKEKEAKKAKTKALKDFKALLKDHGDDIDEVISEAMSIMTEVLDRKPSEAAAFISSLRG